MREVIRLRARLRLLLLHRSTQTVVGDTSTESMTTRPTDAEVNSRERIQIRASGSGSQRRRSAVALVVRPLHTMRLDKNHRRWSIGGFYNFEASFVGAILMVVGGIPLGAAFHSGLHWLAWVSLLPLILGAWLVGWKPSRI